MLQKGEMRGIGVGFKADGRNSLPRTAKITIYIKNMTPGASGAAGQRQARIGGICIHLFDKRRNAVELALIAQAGVEGHRQFGAVEVAREVEQEYFQKRRTIVEGRRRPKLATASKRLPATSTRTA